MKRSKEISVIVAESRRILKKRRKPREDSATERESALSSLLQKAVEMLYTHQDCVDHLKLGLDDDFANLPTEIVYDVIELASFEGEEVVADLKKLALIDGSWAAFGNEFATADRRLRKTNVDSRTDFNKLKAKASQLCDHIQLIYARNQFYEILELVGTRFSSIKWYADENLSELALLQATRFLKRQLKSAHLRRLTVYAKVETEVSDLVVDFVKRPHFEKLGVGGENLVPFELFGEAHKSWESQVPQNSPLRNKEIHAMISHENAKKLKEHFNVTEESVRLKHPVHSEAEADLRVYKRHDKQDHFNVEMTLGSLAERSGCMEDGYVSDCVDYGSSSEESNDEDMDDSDCDSD